VQSPTSSIARACARWRVYKVSKFAGYWTRREDSDKGLSMIVFESEQNANEAVARIRSAAPEDVTVEDVEVREVVASA
jgi:hypothetical protein